MHHFGTHVLIDIIAAKRLDDPVHVEEALRACVDAAGATLLHLHLQRFKGGGVTGVAVLAESHVSIHTWPEFGVAALDVYFCGDRDVTAPVSVLIDAFCATEVRLSHHYRLLAAVPGKPPHGAFVGQFSPQGNTLATHERTSYEHRYIPVQRDI
jgi:S-adenosylmethionine decarboxylase